MNLVSQALPAEIRRKPIVSLGFFLFALFAAYELSHYVVANDVTALAVIGLATVGAVIVIAVLNDWQKGLYFFLGWLLFEDLARKFLGNNMAIYLAKDFLVAVIYLAFFVAARRKGKQLETFRAPFRTVILVFVWFGLLQVFNPASTHIGYGILGMKLYFYYIPLMLVGYALIQSEAGLRTFFHVNLGLMLIIIVLGICQSIVGPGFLNPAVIPDDIRLLSETYRVAPISGVVVYRPTSVFVSTGRFGDMLVVAWLLVFGFSGYLLLRHRRGRIFAFVSLAITAAGCVMCGSRGVFMWSLGGGILGSVAFLWGAPWRHGQALRSLRAIQRAVLGVALAAVVLMFTYPDAFLNRLTVFSETLDPRSSASELIYRTRDYPLKNFLAAFDYDRWPYGYGIGTISLGGQYISRFFHVRPPVGPVESGFGCMIVEMGIGGLILWLVMASCIILSAWKVVRALKGSPWFPLAFMIFLYAFLLLFPMTFMTLQAYQDFVLNAYMWLLLGVLFKLPKLALSAQFAAGSAAQSGGTGTR